MTGPLRQSRNARRFASAQSAWDNATPDDEDEPEPTAEEEKEEKMKCLFLGILLGWLLGYMAAKDWTR